MQFITKQSDYDSMMTRLTALFELGRELPEAVFRVPPARFVFVAEGLVWQPEAWPALTELARFYGDTSIDFVANPKAKPDWMEYGYPHLGAATIGIDEDIHAFRTFGWAGDPSALILGSMSLAIAVRSAGFGMWSQRARDLAVFGLYDLPGRSAVDAPFRLPTIDLDEALGILSMGIPDADAFAEVAEQMRRNYRIP